MPQHFGSRRIIHRAELSSQPDAEVVLDGDDPTELAPGLPRHSDARPHAGPLLPALSRSLSLHRRSSRFRPRRPTAGCFGRLLLVLLGRQAESMRRLASYRFEWVLPGHGQRVRLPADEMQRQLVELVARMLSSSD